MIRGPVAPEFGWVARYARLMRRALVATLLTLLAACAQEPEPTAEPSPTASPETASPSPAPTDDASPESDAECVDETLSGKASATVHQVDDSFSPRCLIVLGGQGLVIRNDGANLHNFSVDGTDVDIDIPPGEVVRTEAISGAVPAGTHTFFCSYHRSRGMEGEITVSEAG